MRLFGWRCFSILVTFGVVFGGCEPALADGYAFTTIDYPGATFTGGYGINNSGQVVGVVRHPAPDFIDSGFLYENGNLSLIRFPGTTLTDAFGISNNGLIVGRYMSGQTFYGFLYDHGTYTTINFPGADSSRAVGVNSKGQIVGNYFYNVEELQGTVHSFLFDGSSYQSIDIPGAISTDVFAINDLGQMLVDYVLGGQGYLAIDDGGNLSTITLPSSAYNISGFNNLDQFVGTFDERVILDQRLHGFVDDDGVIHTFQFPGSTFTVAGGINDFGEVTGFWQGSRTDFPSRGYVATPVPELGSLGLVGTGLLFIATSVRRRAHGEANTRGTLGTGGGGGGGDVRALATNFAIGPRIECRNR